ncbi:MAG: MFS transporter [Negativicutes bacterium]|nr:MFS transporter [Negativicutes bacterium]MDR3591883.1 MFS transporter [Negativicutes bacterium]
MRYRSISLLSAGHLFTDLNQGVVPALLPFFIAEYHLSYTAAASIVFATNIVSSIVQPIFGYLSDRMRKIWLMPLGICCAGVGVALCGLFDSLPLILVAVGLSGFGVAAFHPDAARLANRLAPPENKAMALSIFAVGGNAGFAFGPLLGTGAVLMWGLKGTLVFALPALFMAFFLYFQFRDIALPAVQKATGTAAELPKDQWGPFLRLSGIVVARSVVFFGLNTFIPLYWIHVLHQSNVAGGTALTILFSLGVVSTLIGGRVADRIGYRNMIMGGFALLLPLLAVFTYISDTFWATALLVPISLGLFGVYGPIMVSGQNYLPNRVGFASGVTMGLAITSGGIAAPLLGWLADLYGIQTALQWMIVAPIGAIILALTLPAENKKRKTAESAS